MGHPVFLADLVRGAHQPVGAGQHLFGGRSFCGFRPEPGRLFLQGGRFFLRVGALPPAAGLVGGAGLQVASVAHVVHVHFGAHRVQEPNLIAHRGEQFHVVADEDQPAFVFG